MCSDTFKAISRTHPVTLAYKDFQNTEIRKSILKNKSHNGFFSWNILS
jgi:hypothetical protein